MSTNYSVLRTPTIPKFMISIRRSRWRLRLFPLLRSLHHEPVLTRFIACYAGCSFSNGTRKTNAAFGVVCFLVCSLYHVKSFYYIEKKDVSTKETPFFLLQLICITFLLSLQHPFWYLLLHLHLFPLFLLQEHCGLL